jgi:formylglycine-generating enzyme
MLASIPFHKIYKQDKQWTVQSSTTQNNLIRNSLANHRMQEWFGFPAERFQMGSDAHYKEESPAHDVIVDGFWIDSYTVTNREFRRFVETTARITSAERAPKAEDYPGAIPELLVPASVVFQKPPQRVDMSNPYNWWGYVPGADWRHPQGPESSIEGLDDHPVVHVAYSDAIAYAKWAGKELPTEAE